MDQSRQIASPATAEHKAGRLLLRLLVAAGATAAALGFTLLLPDSRTRPSFLFFIAAAGLSAWYGGWLPGLLSIALGALASAVYVLQPGHKLLVSAPRDQLRLALFATSSVFIVWLIATLKTTQQALRRGRDRFRSAQRAANIGAFDWDMQTGAITWSEELPILRGLVRSGTSAGWREFIHPDDLPRLRAAVQRAIKERTEINADLRILRPEGAVYWVTVRGHIFFEKPDQPSRAIGVVMDITGRKRSEQRLRAQHAITRALAESATAALAAPRVLRIFCEMLDWNLGQLWSLDPVSGRLHRSAAWQDGSPAAAPFEQESRGLTFARSAGVPGQAWAGSQPVWMEDIGMESTSPRLQTAARAGLRSVLAFPILQGEQVLGVLEFFSAELRPAVPELREMAADIGAQIGQFIERRRAQEALRDGEERFRTTLGSIGDAVISTDSHGCVQFINAIAQELTGWSQAEGAGLPLAQIFRVRREDHQPLEDPVQRVAQSGAVVTLNERTVLLTRAGREIPIDDTVAPIRDDQGQFMGAVLVFRDVRARRRAEDALRASEKLAATGRLAASIAHEINNPLESVANLLYMIEHHAGLDDTARNYARLAEQELERMDKIVKQTLGFYREAAAPVPVRVAGVLDNVLELYGRKIQRAGVRVRKNYRFDGEIHAFPGEMRQVFSNLLINALEACGDGGAISLHVTRSRDWTEPQRQGVRVTIADNGPGIPPENLHHIFEPFFTTKGEQGTGLGLWISYGIVQKHGGRIRVRSRTGPRRRGTCFSVFLPGEPVFPQQQAPASRFPQAA